MELVKVISAFIVIVLGLALGPSVFAAALPATPNALNGTAATIAGIVPLAYYVGVMVVAIGALAI